MPKNQTGVGPRGGATTQKRGQVKKTFWLDNGEAEALRKAAYEQRRSEASIVRQALREHLGVDE